MSRGPAPPDAVLFDLDGVIADSRVPFARCVNHALAEDAAALAALLAPAA